MVGGLFALAASIMATNRSAKHNLELAKQERSALASTEREVAIAAIKHEVDIILTLMVGARGTNVLRVYPTSLWERYSHLVVVALDEDTALHLIAGYAAVLIANSFAEYDLQKLGHGMGHVNDDYREQIDSASDSLRNAVAGME